MRFLVLSLVRGTVGNSGGGEVGKTGTVGVNGGIVYIILKSVDRVLFGLTLG